MIRPATAILLSLSAAPALAADRGYPVGNFTGLAIEGSPEVTVTTGQSVSVRASGSDAALDRLNIRVEGRVLRIGGKRDGFNWEWRDHGRVRIAITVPMLSSVDNSGSASVAIDRVKVNEFAANISGSGSVRVAALDADRTSFDVSGSGMMTAAGRCSAGSAKIAGSGELRLAGLKCATLSASIAGSGSIDAFATQTATLATMGSGNINLAGGARCTVSSAGSGKARCV